MTGLLAITLSWSFALVVLAFATYYLTGGLFFTGLPENSIKAIVTNGRLVRFISNVKGKAIDQSDNRLKPLKEIKKENLPTFTWWEALFIKWLGLWWVGFPFIRQLQPLPVDRVVLKPNQEDLDGVLGRLVSRVVTKYELYATFPRPFEMKEVDTNDGFKIDFRFTAMMEVYDPYPAFFELKLDFLRTITSLNSSYVGDLMKGLSWEDFKKGPKDTVKGKISSLFDLEELEKRLEVTGACDRILEVEDFGISKSSERLQKAVEEQKIADEEGKAAEKKATHAKKATITNAEAEKQKRILEGEGDAAAIEVIAKAKAKRYTELIATYTRMGFDGRTAAEKADEQISREFKWDAVSKMPGTYVEGGTDTKVQPIINLGGKK